MSLNWQGDAVVKRIEKASRKGINKIMTDAVIHAKHNTAFTYRTGTAERSIRIAKQARTAGGVSFGYWGSLAVKYFKYLESGTKLTKTRTSIRNRLGIMRTGVVKTKTLPPWRGGSQGPTLRPAAEKMYPKLAQAIKKAWRKA